MFDVEYYEKEDGTFPAEEFILSLDTKMQAKMFRELELLETFGMNCVNLIPNLWEMGYMKFVLSLLLILQGCFISLWSIRKLFLQTAL